MVEERQKTDEWSEVENYKQIYEDLDTGKTSLVDYNNIAECNKYGIPLIKYYKNITGRGSYNTRLRNNLIKKVEYKPVQYIPISSHFFGATMYPRPKSIPFINQNENTKKIINKIKQQEIYKTEKNKNFFDSENSLKKGNSLPSYYCAKLGEDSPKIRNYLIKLFDNFIQGKKNEYDNNPNYYLKDNSFRGVNYYKNALQKNLNKNLFNGKNVPNTKQKDINNKFRIVKRLIKKNAWNSMHLERKNISQDEYDSFQKMKDLDNNKQFNTNYSSLFGTKKGENDSCIINDNDNAIDNDDKYNNEKKKFKFKILPKNKNLNLSDITKKSRQNKSCDTISSLLFNNNNNNNKKNIINNDLNEKKNSSYNNILTKFNSTVTTGTGFNYNNESKISFCKLKNKENIYSPNIFGKSLYKINMQKNNEENSKKEIMDDDEILYNSSRYDFKNKKNENVLKLKDIKNKCLLEKKLLEGYKHYDEKEENQDSGKEREKKVNLISPLHVYIKEFEMFKKVNPIQYENELRKKKCADKLLAKKLQNKHTFERIRIKK